MSKTILITGGCGRIGSRVTDRFLAQGLGVRVVDVISGDRSEVDYRVGDISDRDLMDQATAGVDIVVHLAAIPMENGRARELFEANVHGTFEVMDAAANSGVKGFIFASTVAVYGLLHPSQPFRPAYFPVDEQMPVIPERNYATSKIVGESFLAAYARSHGMDSIALRLATVMNPGAENWRLVAENIQDPEQIFVRDRTMRDFMWQYVHVRDAAQAIERSVSYIGSHPGMGFDAFNIGAADCASTVPSLELISRYFSDVPALKDPAQFARNPNASLYGIDKARRILGFEPEFTWRDQ